MKIIFERDERARLCDVMKRYARCTTNDKKRAMRGEISALAIELFPEVEREHYGTHIVLLRTLFMCFACGMDAPSPRAGAVGEFVVFAPVCTKLVAPGVVCGREAKCGRKDCGMPTAAATAPPPAAPVVVPVEVTAEMLGAIAKQAHEQCKIGEDVIALTAQMLNDATRARAADVVPCRVVRRPTYPASMLVVPAGVRYMWLLNDRWTITEQQPRPIHLDKSVSEYRVVFDDGTTGPRVDRTTTAQPRPWEPADCEVMVGRMVAYLWSSAGVDHGTVLRFATDSAAEIATTLERVGAHTAYVLPSDVPHALTMEQSRGE